MSVKTQNGQASSSKGVDRPEFANRKSDSSFLRRWLSPQIVSKRTVFQMLFGRIRWAGYSRIIQTAYTSVLRCLAGTSTFEQVDDGDER
jgi:spore cortex formation protein SpoVR/YcgB (stage V sporulation)